MKSTASFTLCLSLAAFLLQAGCSTEGAAIANLLPYREHAATVIVPEGAMLIVRTTSALSTATLVAGQTFTAHLEEPLLHGGRTMAPQGAEVRGIVAAVEGGPMTNAASTGFRLTALRGINGFVEISTNTLPYRDAAVIPAGSVLTFSLRRPVMIVGN